MSGSCHTAALAIYWESSWQKVWGVSQTLAFSAFNIAKETLLIDLTLCENGNCDEKGSLTVVTCWHLHVWPFSSTGDRYAVDSWKYVRSIVGQHRQGIELRQVLVLSAWQSLLNALLILDRTGTGNVIPSSERISGRLNTEVSETKHSS